MQGDHNDDGGQKRRKDPDQPVRNMEEYRALCKELDMVRLEKKYAAEKKLILEEQAIQKQYEAEVREANEAYSKAAEEVQMRMFMENMERTRHLEERLYGLPQRSAEYTTDSGLDTYVAERVKTRRQSLQGTGSGQASGSNSRRVSHFLTDAEVEEDLEKMGLKSKRNDTAGN